MLYTIGKLRFCAFEWCMYCLNAYKCRRENAIGVLSSNLSAASAGAVARLAASAMLVSIFFMSSPPCGIGTIFGSLAWSFRRHGIGK